MSYALWFQNWMIENRAAGYQDLIPLSAPGVSSPAVIPFQPCLETRHDADGDIRQVGLPDVLSNSIYYLPADWLTATLAPPSPSDEAALFLNEQEPPDIDLNEILLRDRLSGLHPETTPPMILPPLPIAIQTAIRTHVPAASAGKPHRPKRIK